MAADLMTPQTAGELIRTLLRVSCSLDHAVAGAVREGMTDQALRTFKRTAGEVMGLVYCYLGPCFSVVPDLDPGRGGKPLGDGPLPIISGTPENFIRLLEEVEQALQQTAAAYDAALSEQDKAWLNGQRQEVLDATKSGRTAIAGLTN